MWGISSLFATALFKLSPNINALWLSQIRQLTAGPILLVIAALTGGHPIGIFTRKRRNLITLICYGIFGMLPVQFCYFMAVQEGNAAIATVLQFVGPFFIIGYVALFRHQRPLRIQVVAAVIAFLGVYCWLSMVTLLNWRLHQLFYSGDYSPPLESQQIPSSRRILFGKAILHLLSLVGGSFSPG